MEAIICEKCQKEVSETFMCEQCEAMICDACQATYNQFSQIDFNCCQQCADSSDE